MAGRNKIFKEEVALADAMKVFWQYGYEGASMTRLLKAMGLNKGSLYHSFGSKKELFLRVVDQYSDELEEFIENRLKQSDSVIDAIQELYRGMIQTDDKDIIKQGCLLVNTIAELAYLEPSLKEIAAHRLRMLEEIFIKHLNIARQKGEINAQTPSEVVAKHLITLYSGIQINRKLYPYRDGLSQLLEVNLALLNQYKTA